MIAPSPDLVRIPRRLLLLLAGVELLLTPLEVLAVVGPLTVFFPAVSWHPEILGLIGLTLALWFAVVGLWIRPLVSGVAPDRRPAAYRLCLALPDRGLLLRLACWGVIGAGTALILARADRLEGAAVITVLAVSTVHSFGVTLLRHSLHKRLLRRTITSLRLAPSWAQLQADTLFNRLVEVALALGAITCGVLALFVVFFLPISLEQFRLLETTFPWVAVVFGFIWYFAVAPRLARPLLAYLRRTAPPGTPDEHALLLAAVENGQRLPGRLAALKLGFFTATGLALALDGTLLLGYTTSQAVLLLGAIILVTLGTSIYELIWARAVLRSLTAHLAAQPGAERAAVRPPSLRRKMLHSFGSVLVFAVALPLFWSYLQLGAGRSAGDLAAMIVFFAVVLAVALGVVVLTSKDLTRPIAALEQRAAAMAEGRLDERLVPAGEFDEIGRLTLAFETMRRALQTKLQTIEQLNAGLEGKVQERTAELARSNAELVSTIDALKEAQQRLVLSEKMASVGQLVAGIAHEINNPLNAVVNVVEPLGDAVRELRSGRPATAAEADDLDSMLRVIRSGAQRTQRIVQALRNYTRQDGEARSRMDLHADLEESLALLKHALGGVEIVRELRATPELEAYRGQLNQAVLNLIANAAAALEGRAGARLTLRTRDAGDRVVIEVEDNGPGIPEAVLPRIFDPFFTTKEVGKGTGLGLSITHGVVERHGGVIRVRTGSGGTTFTVELPRTAPPTSP